MSPAVHQRNSIACDRCRSSHKKCQPPYPCRPCRLSGVECQVRSKARPQRQRRRVSPEQSTLSSTSSAVDDADHRRCNDEVGAVDASRSASRSPRGRTEDPLDQMRALLVGSFDTNESICANAKADLSEPRYSFSTCNLPPLDSLSVDESHIMYLLSQFEQILAKLGACTIDVEEMRQIARIEQPHIKVMDSENYVAGATFQHSADIVALLYACLAIAAHACCEPSYAHYYRISEELVKYTDNQPTIHLCRTHFVQHHFMLRAGSCEQARALISRTIQNAHDIYLEHGAEGTDGLQLYLLIYVADQYSSLTHGTPPIIKSTSLPPAVFAPILEIRPHLTTFVRQVMLNGEIFDQVLQYSAPLGIDALNLEAKISKFCIENKLTGKNNPADEECFLYESVANIHMLYSRLCLRIPMLSNADTWLSSLSVCCQASQKIISAYFDIFYPTTISSAVQLQQQSTSWLDKIANQNSLPRTWRQVRRIILSTFVLIYAYIHQEVGDEETLRYMMKARILLSYQRTGWSEALRGYCKTLTDLCRSIDPSTSVYDDPICYVASRDGAAVTSEPTDAEIALDAQYLAAFEGFPTSIEDDMYDMTAGDLDLPLVGSVSQGKEMLQQHQQYSSFMGDGHLDDFPLVYWSF